MMSSVDQLIQPLLHSPYLPQAMAVLQAELEAEHGRRQEFYEQMTPDQKTEFIAGQVVLHSPARNRHLDVTANIFRLVSTYVAIHRLGQVKYEKCLCVFPRNDYEPDVVFFGQKKAAGFTADTVKFPVPDMVVEVLSASKQAHDRGLKFEDYAANGVDEYWIVDADAKFVEQYLLEGEQYKLAIKSGTGLLNSRAIEGMVIPMAAMFDEQANLRTIREYLDSVPD